MAIARALANSPRLILADEPTASLDTARGKKVMELLKKIAKENQSAVIVVTHDVRMIEGFDQVYHLKDEPFRSRKFLILSPALRRRSKNCFNLFSGDRPESPGGVLSGLVRCLFIGRAGQVPLLMSPGESSSSSRLFRPAPQPPRPGHFPSRPIRYCHWGFGTSW